MKLCLNPNWNNFDTWPLLSVSSMRLWDTGVTWLDCEKVKGQYDFTTLDKQLSAMAAHGIVDFVYTAGKIPAFYTVIDVAAFSAFVQALAARIAANWKGAWFFEQWNEPNLKQYWTGTPDQLLAFSRAAYAILKPLGVKVLSPSGSGGTAIGSFILSYLTACAKDYPFDVFAYHAYLQDGQRAAANIAKILNDIKVKKGTFGISAPTWFTEGSWGKEADYNPPLADAEKIAYMSLLVSSMATAGVERFYWYTYSNVGGWGTLATGTALTPAGLAFQALVNGGSVPTTSTVNIPVPAVQPPNVASKGVMVAPPPIQVDPQIITPPAVTPPALQITVTDATTSGVTQTWAGTNLTLTDKTVVPPPPPPPPLPIKTPSPDGATLAPADGGSIIDAALNTWTYGTSSDTRGSVINLNGAATTSNAALLLFYKGQMYCKTLSGNWWGPPGQFANHLAGDPRVSVNPNPQPQPVPSGVLVAFPGAQGGGGLSAGGRGGVVIEVTNLNDSGTGSLRAALETAGARTIVFRVAGMITPLSRMQVNSPFLTIAGQTAPGQILIGGPNQANESLFISTHDVIVRYCTFSADNRNVLSGPSTGTMNIEIANGDTHDIIFDHVSSRWAGNKLFGIVNNYVGPTNKLTLQWSMLYEPHAGHPVGPGNAGPFLYPASDNDFHHNLLANFSHRIPEANFIGNWSNNITYNWLFYAFARGGRVDLVGNRWIPGNLNKLGAHAHPVNVDNVNDQYKSEAPSLYLSGNLAMGDSVPAADQFAYAMQWTGENGNEVGPLPTSWRRTAPLASVVPITYHSQDELDAALLPVVGNSQHLDLNGNWVSHRDAADTRIVNQYKNKLPGGFWPNGITTPITNQTSPSQIPDALPDWQDKPITGFTPYPSKFHNGLSDAWVQAMQLDTNDASLNNNIDPKTGMTWLEVFLSGK